MRATQTDRWPRQRTCDGRGMGGNWAKELWLCLSWCSFLVPHPQVQRPIYWPLEQREKFVQVSAPVGQCGTVPAARNQERLLAVPTGKAWHLLGDAIWLWAPCGGQNHSVAVRMILTATRCPQPRSEDGRHGLLLAHSPMPAGIAPTDQPTARRGGGGAAPLVFLDTLAKRFDPAR